VRAILKGTEEADGNVAPTAAAKYSKRGSGTNAASLQVGNNSDPGGEHTSSKTSSSVGNDVAQAEGLLLEMLSEYREGRRQRKANATSDADASSSSVTDLCDFKAAPFAAFMLRDRFRSIDVIAEAYDPHTPPLPPFLLVHGDADQLIPISHSLVLALAILRCPNTVHRAATHKVWLEVKPGGGHNDVLYLFEKSRYIAELVERPLSRRYVSADGSPEPIPDSFVRCLDRNAVPHAVAHALSEAAGKAHVAHFKICGAALIVAATLSLLYGAVAVPILAYGATGNAGLCASTHAVHEYGVASIANLLRIALTTAANGIAHVGHPRYGLRRQPIFAKERIPTALYFIACILTGLLSVAALPMAVLDCIWAAGVLSHDHTSACSWIIAGAPAILSAMLGCWALGHIFLALIIHH
jgi:hypothetical protein